MEKLWTTSEAARHLGLDEHEIERLIGEGKLTGYKLAGQFLRFRPDQVKALRGQLQPRPASVAAVTAGAGAPVVEQWQDKVRDAWYFYDFYLLSFVLLAGLVLYLVASS